MYQKSVSKLHAPYKGQQSLWDSPVTLGETVADESTMRHMKIMS